MELDRFHAFVKERIPFSFIRFSDGEVEILRNRKLFIGNSITEFRGRVFNNNFPEFDNKSFDPTHGKVLRKDLLEAATFKAKHFFKGIPTAHNNAISDREFLLRLNGGRDCHMTFSDLFLNSNFIHARKYFFPSLISNFDDIFVVGNFRCNLSGDLIKGSLIPIQDNFFTSYLKTKTTVMSALQALPKCCLVLSSASSLSNIIGKTLRQSRPDITFIDVGTVLNDLLGLELGTRDYHFILKPKKISEHFLAWRFKSKKTYKLRW